MTDADEPVTEADFLREQLAHADAEIYELRQLIVSLQLDPSALTCQCAPDLAFLAPDDGNGEWLECACGRSMRRYR